MTQITFITACQACGAKNRVCLSSGSRVRIRCGKCGEPIAVDSRRMVLKAAGQHLAAFFGRTLPNFLLRVFDLVAWIVGGLLKPPARALRLIPWKHRQRLAWVALAVLAVYYFLAEGTIKFSSLLLLAALLALATLVMVVAARGPRALREIKNKLSGKILRRCPNCGHRYFPLVRNCPACGH